MMSDTIKNDSNEKFHPFIVKANLVNGISVNPYHRIALDGLLASALRSENSFVDGIHVRPSILDKGLHTDNPTVIELPLKKCYISGEDLWHWEVTNGQFLDKENNVLPFDFSHTIILNTLKERKIFTTSLAIPQYLGGVKGRYRNKRTPILTIPAAQVIWAGIGNSVEVLKILENNIYTLGKKRNIGEGWIESWNIETFEADCLDEFIFSHIHPFGQELGRPLPEDCAKLCLDKIEDVGISSFVAGIRPPLFHQSTQHTLYVTDL